MKRYDWIRLSATLNEAQNNGSTKLVLEDFSFGCGTMLHLVDFLQRKVTSERSIQPTIHHYQVDSLHFESCVISREKKSLFILCDYFSSMAMMMTGPRLREVSITDCPLGNENAALLLASMSSATTMSSSSSLKVLRLADVDMCGPEAGRLLGTVLKQNPQLHTLEVSSCPLGREGIRSLRLSLTTTTTSSATTTPSSSAAAESVARSTGTRIDLRRLSLSKCAIGNEGLAELILLDFANILPLLQDIELRRNNFSGEAGGRLLYQLVQNMLVATAAAAAAQNDHRLRHRRHAVSDDYVMSIDFGGGNPIGCAGLRAFGPALAACGNRLKSLVLDDCCGGDDGGGGGGSLVEALEYLRICLQHCSTSLVQLNLADNGIPGRGTQQCLQVIERLLRHHNGPSLKKLDLSSNPLGVHGARILAPALRDHEEWDLLNLQLCSLGDMGVALLVENGLNGHAGLKCINLSRNQCTGASLPCLTMLLNETRNLEELVLFSNDIFQNTNNVDNANNNNFEQVKFAFLEAIANHETLRAIDLRNTYNTATTIRRTVLNDNNNDPSVAIADYLVSALQNKNTSLDTVHVDANRDQRKLIDSYAKRNELLKQVRPLLLEASTTDRSDSSGNRWFLALEQFSRREEGINASYKVLHKMVEHGFFQGDKTFLMTE